LKNNKKLRTNCG